MLPRDEMSPSRSSSVVLTSGMGSWNTPSRGAGNTGASVGGAAVAQAAHPRPSSQAWRSVRVLLPTLLLPCTVLGLEPVLGAGKLAQQAPIHADDLIAVPGGEHRIVGQGPVDDGLTVLVLLAHQALQAGRHLGVLGRIAGAHPQLGPRPFTQATQALLLIHVVAVEQLAPPGGRRRLAPLVQGGS